MRRTTYDPAALKRALAMPGYISLAPCRDAMKIQMF
nr:MAG TPA: hypothetical protein [Caudoviricetes sp.]